LWKESGGGCKGGEEEDKSTSTHRRILPVPALVLLARLVLGRDSVRLAVPGWVVHGSDAFPRVLQVPEKKKARKGAREGREVIIDDVMKEWSGRLLLQEQMAKQPTATHPTPKRTVGPGPRTQAGDDPGAAAGLGASFPVCREG